MLTMIWSLKYTNINNANARFSDLHLKFTLVEHSFDYSHTPPNDRSSLICPSNFKNADLLSGSDCNSLATPKNNDVKPIKGEMGIQDTSTLMRGTLCAGCLASMAELPSMGGSAF
jgi:hypothetical protein